MSTKPNSLTASDLFARSQGMANHGDTLCHWCGSLATREFLHDDVPPIPFVRSRSTARHPVSPYICVGCWLWKRKRVTIRYLDGGYKDGQCAENHSWLITEESSLALRPESYHALYETLLVPPLRFVLALRLDDRPNVLQLMEANNPGGVIGETLLTFTLGGIRHQYSPYELEEAVKNGPEGVEPGVRVLTEYLGVPEELRKKLRQPREDREAKKKEKGRGRPPASTDEAKFTTMRVITNSGK